MIDLKPREEVLKQLYVEFYNYFVSELQKVKTATDKIKLHLVAEFFDDIALYNKITPLFSQATTTLAEKKAVARAALWDALVAAHFGSYTDKLQGFIANRLADLEEFVAGLKKLPNLATHQYVVGVESRVKAIEEKLLSEIRGNQEQPAAAPQAEAGPTEGVQAEGNAVGPTGTQEAGS